MCSSLTVYVPLEVLLAAIAPRIRGDARRTRGGQCPARRDAHVGHRGRSPCRPRRRRASRGSLAKLGKLRARTIRQTAFATMGAASRSEPPRGPPEAARAVRGVLSGLLAWPRRQRKKRPHLRHWALMREKKSTHTAGTTKSMPFFGDDAVYADNANDRLYGGGFTSDRPIAHEGLTGHPGYPPSILRPVPSAPPFRLTTPVRCQPSPRGPPAGRRTGAASR